MIFRVIDLFIIKTFYQKGESQSAVEKAFKTKFGRKDASSISTIQRYF